MHNVKISKIKGQFEIGFCGHDGITTLGFSDSNFKDICDFVNALNATADGLGCFKIFENGEDMFIPA